MVDEGSGAYASSRPWEDRGGRAVGTVLAAAIAAGVIAYIVRRSRSDDDLEVSSNQLARLARDWASSDSVEAGREFVMDKIVPELKPALLSALSEIEDIVDQTFRRIERNIKKL
ncbi:MAG: hypothetical protein JO352_37350 [Chloroflexi bacterium]|nr:hypothetical protein [Chloroflexota bacterium]MBV9598036.1 hypothetical protein [Chloroflexota bacterium]